MLLLSVLVSPPLCAILMDLSKAFDCISHKLLIAKFRSYGLPMSACHLLTSYLRDRTQRVKFGDTKSKWLHIDQGSAQGSILGPFCYNVFTNDMLSIVSDTIEIYNYADYNTVICSGYEYEDIKAELMLNVDKIIEWFRDNHMKVNPDKFHCIVFGNVVNPGTFIICLILKSPYQQLLHNCGKSTLFLQRLQKLMEVIYRILNGLYPSYLNDIITVEELQHLRCQYRLLIPPFSTIRYVKKTLSYLSPVLWNSLGNDIEQCNLLTAFKKRIKLWKGPTCNCGFCTQCRISNIIS